MTTNIVKTGCATLLLSLMLTAPSLACVYQRYQPTVCTMGTKGGKCVNPVVASASQCGARQVVTQINEYIPNTMATGEAGTDDPLLRSNARQPEYGLNSTPGFSGGGGRLTIYGRY